MRLQWRLVWGAASSAAAWLLWPTAALAGNCPWLVNCAGGNVKVAGACAVGAAFSAALCLPGGEWRGNSDDFGGGGSSTTVETPAPVGAAPYDAGAPNDAAVDPNVYASRAPEILADNAGGLGGGLAGIGGDNNNPPGPNPPQPNPTPDPSPQPVQPQASESGQGGGGAGGLIDGIGGGGGQQPGPGPSPGPSPSPQPSPSPAAAGGGGTPNPNPSPSPSPGATPASPAPDAPAGDLPPIYRKDGKLVINMALGDPEDLKNLPPASTPDPSSAKPAPSPTPSASPAPNPSPSPSPGPTPPGPKPKLPLGGLGGD